MSVYLMWPQKAGKAVQSLKTGVIYDCESPCRFSGTKLRFSGREAILFTPETLS